MNNMEIPNNVVIKEVISRGGNNSLLSSTNVGTVMIGGLFFYAMYRICRDAVESVSKTYNNEFKKLNKKLKKTLKKVEKE